MRIADRARQALVVDTAEHVRDVMDASGFTDIVRADAFLAIDADAVARLDEDE
ncbi:MAG: hypothetical protein WEB19_04260 [Acidimicrobiia bacterium]